MKKYLVYRHTCPSGLSYIGMTSNYNARCTAHRQSMANGKNFSNAILHFGWDNFRHEIVRDELSKAEALELEEYLIAKENTIIPNGYNIPYFPNRFLKPKEESVVLRLPKNIIEKLNMVASYYEEKPMSLLKRILDFQLQQEMDRLDIGKIIKAPIEENLDREDSYWFDE